MIVKAKAKYIRVSPLKMRRLANMVRGEKLLRSIEVLKLTNVVNKKYLLKVLESVKANAKMRNPDADLDAIKIDKLIINEGPRIKRMKPRARGRADVIKKRISHIEVEVDVPEVQVPVKGKKAKAKGKA